MKRRITTVTSLANTRAKRTVAWLGLIVGSAAAGCAANTKTSSGPTPAPNSDVPAFQWPALAANAAPECASKRARVASGYAFADEFWIAVGCTARSLPSSELDPFISRAHDYAANAGRDAFVSVQPKQLLPPLDQELAWTDTQEGELVTVYVVDPEKRKRLLATSQPHLGFGSYRGLCLPWQAAAGHSDVTESAARKVRGIRFSNAAIGVLADAAQDPDLFDWTTMPAHGQSDSDAAGRPTDSKRDRVGFVQFVRSHLDKAATFCARGDVDSVRQALYWTGYALHAVEDVAPHRGRTNPDHAYYAYVKKRNPDKDPNAPRLAEEMATELLERALARSLTACAAKFASYAGPPVTLSDKLTTLGRIFDNNPAELKAYHDSANVFAAVASDPAAYARWFGDKDETPASCKGECAALLDEIERPR